MLWYGPLAWLLSGVPIMGGRSIERSAAVSVRCRRRPALGLARVRFRFENRFGPYVAQTTRLPTRSAHAVSRLMRGAAASSCSRWLGNG